MPRCYRAYGYGHLFHSLMRFTAIDPDDCANLLYRLCAANIDTCRLYYPSRFYYEVNPAAFLNELSRHKRPYRTEVQLYKAMEALSTNIDRGAIIGVHKDACDWLLMLIDELQARFYRAYHVDIADTRTVYRLCRFHLLPTQNEPYTCFMDEYFSTECLVLMRC